MCALSFLSPGVSRLRSVTSLFPGRTFADLPSSVSHNYGTDQSGEHSAQDHLHSLANLHKALTGYGAVSVYGPQIFELLGFNVVRNDESESV